MAETTIEAIQEKPILFSGAMIRAILEGKKTQTRRVVKPQPPENSVLAELCNCPVEQWGEAVGREFHFRRAGDNAAQWHSLCPYGAPGTRLWVRESFARCACDACRSIWPAKTPHGILGYQATYGGPSMMVFRPSIHMPRWASRLTLEIEKVRVERVQEISEEDAKAEGVEAWKLNPDQALTSGERAGDSPFRSGFALLWDEINALREGGIYAWNANPWVWAITFKVIPSGRRTSGEKDCS